MDKFGVNLEESFCVENLDITEILRRKTLTEKILNCKPKKNMLGKQMVYDHEGITEILGEDKS